VCTPPLLVFFTNKHSDLSKRTLTKLSFIMHKKIPTPVIQFIKSRT
jgi:hypothetical protein